jgi:hypothetical protein
MQIVQEGAALAPGWTEAMFHELLDQEASPASGAALHHAADIMSLHDTAKAQHCMAGMQQTISGGVLLLCVMPKQLCHGPALHHAHAADHLRLACCLCILLDMVPASFALKPAG